MYNDASYLAHHGTLGQKWGNRRYQNLDGSLTSLGREHYGIGPARGSKEAKREKAKEARQEKREKRKAAKKAKSEFESHEAKMRYLRDHPKQLYKNRYTISEEDAKKIMAQIEFDKKLKDVRKAEIDRGWAKVKSFSDNAKTVYSLLNTSKAVYNLMVETNNMLVEEGKSNGTIHKRIGDSPDKDKK